MNRYIVIVMIVLAGLLADANLFAQGRNHDVIMRDIRTAYRSLGENLEATEQSAAVDNANRLAGYFREIEAFWARLETQDAMGFASDAAEAASIVAARTVEQDYEGAQVPYEVLGATCGSCHAAHRETIVGGFTIMP